VKTATTIRLFCLDGKLYFRFEQARLALEKAMPSFSEVPSVIASDAREFAWVGLCHMCEEQSLQLRSLSLSMHDVQSDLEVRFCELALAFLKELSK